MKSGTPGFVGARLREAREARGLSAIVLANLVGVTRQAISQYESDEQTPRPEVADAICQKLDLSIQFFLREMDKPLRNEHSVFYRSLKGVSKEERISAVRRFDWLQDIALYVEQFVELPPVNFPTFELPSDITQLSDKDIEDFAIQTRRFWRLGDGPISNIIWLLENNGAIVCRISLDAESLDAFSTWEYDRPFVALSSGKGSAVRSRLDAGHELAHLVLHRSLNIAARESHHDLLEKQAHRFSGAFLFPKSAFLSEIHRVSLDALRLKKERWRLSIAMMVMRAKDLGLIDEATVRHLFISYNRKKWRQGEPLDDVLEAESPRLVSQAFQMMISEQLQSRSDIKLNLPFSLRDIEELANLPQHYLRRSDESLRGLRPRFSGASGEVIPFPTPPPRKV